jgi:SAM-dependent methyltransferase
MNKEILKKVDRYYSDKIAKHGATSKGVDWNGRESHVLRFSQLCKVFSEKNKFTLLDYGCGYGSLIEYLNENKIPCQYTGFDISKMMIEKAKERHLSKNSVFISELDSSKYDYTIANGIFNVKLDSSDIDWRTYVLETIQKINSISLKGFSFNILTSYSDEDYKKDYLYYANPLFYFDYCKNNFSKNVALLHDYNLYEFTIILRK